jgi:hypothetical protein
MSNDIPSASPPLSEQQVAALRSSVRTLGTHSEVREIIHLCDSHERLRSQVSTLTDQRDEARKEVGFVAKYFDALQYGEDPETGEGYIEVHFVDGESEHWWSARAATFQEAVALGVQMLDEFHSGARASSLEPEAR